MAPGKLCKGVHEGQRTIPVALDRLGGEGGHDAKIFAEAVQQPARAHDLVAHLRGAHRADLELPLPGHHLRVDAADDQARLHVQPWKGHNPLVYSFQQNPEMDVGWQGQPFSNMPVCINISPVCTSLFQI